MSDDPQSQPAPELPQYEPPQTFAHPKQAKMLMKLVNRMLRPKPKARVSTRKNSVARKEHEKYGWIRR